MIFNDNNPNFIVCGINEIKSGYVNYWIYPTEIILEKNIIDYKYKTQSLRERDSISYIQGHIRLKKIKDNWIITKSQFENYDFEVPKDITCYQETIVCNTDFNRPTKSAIDNPFFGDWQYLYDSSYVEVEYEIIDTARVKAMAEGSLEMVYRWVRLYQSN